MEEKETGIQTIVRNSWSIEKDQVIEPSAEELAHIKWQKDLGSDMGRGEGTMPYPHTIITTIRSYKNPHADSPISLVAVCKSRSEDTGRLKKFEVKVSFNDIDLGHGFIKSFQGKAEGNELIFNVGAKSRLNNLMNALNAVGHFSEKMKEEIAAFCMPPNEKDEENVARVRAELFGGKPSVSLFDRANITVNAYRGYYADQKALSEQLNALKFT